MSAETAVTLRCDGRHSTGERCEEKYTGEPGSSVQDVRLDAAEMDGWESDSRRDDDRCSGHAPSVSGGVW